ncbi:MAG TPA: hypothetical protein V6D21_07270, partial [Candidatus Obscuribacterales bacterium]
GGRGAGGVGEAEGVNYNNVLPITHYPLPITHYPLPITTHYPLPITHYLLPITYLPVELYARSQC